MRSPVLIILILFLAIPLNAQYSWRFSPSYTFEAPAFSKEELSDRALTYRLKAEFEMNAPPIYQYDTKHQTSWFLFTDQKVKAKSRTYDTIIKMFVSILPENGKYTVVAEKCEASARSNGRALFEFEILRADDSVYTDKRVKEVIIQIKAFIQEQFDALIPQIREIMENPLDGFHLQEVVEE